MATVEQTLADYREEHSEDHNCNDYSQLGSEPGIHIDRRCKTCKDADEILRMMEVNNDYYKNNQTLKYNSTEKVIILQALAHLSVERPGFLPALEQIAIRMDNIIVSPSSAFRRIPRIFTELRRLKKGQMPLSQEIVARRIKS